MAGLAYFAAVFVIAFGLGMVRVFLLEPALPRFAAVLIEAPFLLAAILWAARALPPRFGPQKDPAGLLLMGVLGLTLQQLADATLGLTLRGVTLREQYAQFARPEGWLFAGLLVAFLLAPFALSAGAGTRAPPRAAS